MGRLRHSTVFKSARDEAYAIIATLKPDPVWTNSSSIKRMMDNAFDDLNSDMTMLKKNAIHESVKPTLIQWHDDNETAPSLLAMALYACDTIIGDVDDMSQSILTALIITAVLGEVPNTLSYHNSLHYKKVMLQMMRLLVEICNDLSQTDKLTLLMAVCIHDLGHTGHGNKNASGNYVQAFLERRSYHLAMKYINAVVFKDKAVRDTILHDLRVILLCTDVSSPAGEESFSNQAKLFFKDKSASLDPEIYAIKRDERLLLMTVLMHEADVATSAGVDYEVTARETVLFFEEAQNRPARPSDVAAFLKGFSRIGFVTHAGQKLFGENTKTIATTAKNRVADGDDIIVV